MSCPIANLGRQCLWSQNSLPPSNQQPNPKNKIPPQNPTIGSQLEMEFPNRANARWIDRQPGLSSDIIEEILLNLPVKSLLRFRCVSKSWCSLIDSKTFIKAHLEKSRKDSTLAGHRIIIVSQIRPFRSHIYTLKHCSLPSLLDEPYTFVSTIDYPFWASSRAGSVPLVSCCNGLICIMNPVDVFYLWNPSTRMYRKLPASDDCLKRMRISGWGFGFDESNEDFKVFVLYKIRSRTEARIYSLNNDCWRKIKGINLEIWDKRGIFVNGKLHWWAGTEIVSFDLEREECGQVQLHSQLEADCLSGSVCCNLWKVNGCLCVVSVCPNSLMESSTEIWVLKEYEVMESWTKVVTIPQSYINSVWNFSSLQPFFISQVEEILMNLGWRLAFYRPNQPIYCPNMDDLGEIMDAQLYIESLTPV